MGERMENTIESRFNPEIVNELEKTPFLIDEDKMILLLTLIGEKPAATFYSRLDFGSTVEDEKKFLDESDFLSKWLEKSGLVFSIEEKIIKSEEGKPISKIVTFNIACDKAALDRLDEADKGNNKKEIGLALGYPATAVEAFSKNDVKDRDDLPFDLNGSEVSDFLFFRLSKEHWAEEFETVKRWQMAIKDNFPDFYKRFTDMRPKIDSLEKMAAMKQRDEKLYQELLQEKQNMEKR
ncbi:MAG: hypothetical protein AAB740_04205 [Patescibacteria group bacterium]